MPYDASGGTVSSSRATGSIDPHSGALLAAPASAPEGPIVPAVASCVIADPSSTDADLHVHPQRWLTLPLVAEHPGTSVREPPVLPLPRDQPEVARLSGRTGSNTLYALHYIRPFGQVAKELR